MTRQWRVWIGCACLVTAIAYAQAPAPQLETVQALAIDAAQRICGTVPSSGWDASANAKASIDVPLGKFLKKLVDAKVFGAADVNGGAYSGPLREQLKDVRKDTQGCQQDVFTKLLQFVLDQQKAQHVPVDRQIAPERVKLVPVSVNHPKTSAEDFALHWLGLMDKGAYGAAYALLDPFVQVAQSEASFAAMAKANVAKCYPAKKRREDYAASQIIPGQVGLFGRDEYGFQFKTTYRSMDTEPREANELVGVVLAANGEWRTIEYHGCQDAT